MATNKTKKNFIGLAWPYVNGDLHIGHFVGYALPGDIFARYKRFLGEEVLMVSGSDCFGTPTTVEADKKGLKPADIVNQYHPERKKLFEFLDVSYDLYTQTNTENHIQTTQKVFTGLVKNGYIIKQTSNQFYSEEVQKFLPDRYVEGECPICGGSGARSDQCEKCGSILEPEMLIDPVSKLTGHRVALKPTEHYFLDWTKLQDFAEKYADSKSPIWRDWANSETQKWLKEGLKPRAITRDMDWGVPIPELDGLENGLDGLKLEGAENKRIYVWFEAVIGYLSASIEYFSNTENPDAWKSFWYDSEEVELKHYYFLGKDNLVFHSIFWPGELHGFDKNIHLPDMVAGNCFLDLDGQKFSKSNNVILDPKKVATEYGLEELKFYLCSIMPENGDSSFSWADFEIKVNNSLIANLGNFVYRSQKLGLKTDFESQKHIHIESSVQQDILESLNTVRESLEKCEFKKYIHAVLSLSQAGNKYIQQKSPWLVKDKFQYDKIMINLMAYILGLSIVIKPIFPRAFDRLGDMLGTHFENWPEDEIDSIKQKIGQIKLNPEKINPLFKKIELNK